VLGCEPADVSERMGLSAPVAGAVEEAARLAQRLAENAVQELRSGVLPGHDE
jgi:hydrogenase maturation protease